MFTPTPTLTFTPTPTATSPSAICPSGDAGNDFNAATSLTPYTEKQEYICPSSDVDWWKFPVSGGQEISLFLSDMPRGPDADYDLFLVSPTQGGVASSERWGADKDEYIYHVALQSGDYWVLVRGKGVADWSAKHPYKLLARVCYADEAGDNAASATVLSPGAKTGYLCPPGDEDWYQFTLAGAPSVAINAGLSNLPADYDLYLYGPNNQVVTASVFQVILPFAPGATRLVVANEGGVLAERPISPHAPGVHVLAPNGGEVVGDGLEIRWEAHDEDGDPLHYTVQYSPDEGATWQALATNVPTTTLRVSAASLPASDRALIRVIATDGVNTGSDLADRPFIVPPHPPQVFITAPADGASFTQGQMILFTGATLDTDEGPLAADRLVWTSDRDGFLGEGDELAVTTLSPGRHMITLTATDSAGLVAETAIRVSVRGELYLPLVVRTN